jgi:hypothetical protein
MIVMDEEGSWVYEGDFGERRIIDSTWVGKAIKCFMHDRL